MNSIKNEFQCSIAPAPDAKPKLGRFAQVFWMAALVGPLPLVLSPILADLQRMQSWPVCAFSSLIWCVAVSAFIAMVYSRWNKVACFPVTFASRIFFVGGIACYLFSIAFGSVWVAIMGWTLHCAAWLATHSGSKDNDYGKLLIHWPAVCVLLQLPSFLEIKLVLAHKQLLSVLTASCLDVLGIPFRNDNLSFEFTQTTLTVNEVLVNSQPIAWFLFTSCIIIAWLRRPFVLLPAYLTVMLFWTLGTQLVQLAVIGFAQERYQLDFSTGWLSVLLNATTLVMAVGLFLSSDRLLRILFMPVLLDESSRGPLNPICRGWNWLLLPLVVNSRARI